MNIKRIILVGKAASGKTWLAEQLIKMGYNFPLSYTTRPKRNNETDDVHYNFISTHEFLQMISENLMYEYAEFNNWFYGRTKKDFYSGNLLIMTPSTIKKMNKDDRKSSYVIYLDINEDIRKERLSKRNDIDGVMRRLIADENDFKNFKDYDYKISRPNFTASDVQNLIDENCILWNKPKKSNNKINKLIN